ncbi:MULTISPECIES: Asp23/Gls24 family envelope stress response protein [Corynebacterium]|uniref:Asp23/Gls24 family envelope stress response protein n=1 Tax=Corynebacterium haemomassiliense TaxID=2754726 RepID=A0A7W2ECG2_9CORY|nr:MULTISPECIES: Asp23/Gls24 family envelope stress response protein [Corynebacterium]MBA5245124.1 Asp23/Gls24 family envelope stress response protein [Corynebacterium haemomassiliense]MCG7235810.1 Asp23/Gls24 family envelope stress response protein [Corynebacterium sp. ACRQP]MCG7289335.1 Asp23/Gls24 family envelope stress response protein [Corynebacterium sp. ACRPZ]MCG7293449.1 Asp23/Gls24 family envelope stress response protein [Corynebacterium sp. ACRPY]
MDNSFYHVSERTIERVAEVAAAAVPGCRTIDAKLAGLAGRSFPRIHARLDQATGTVAVDTEIATSYPAPVAAITDAVRATIIAHIRTLVGLDVSRVKVTVANVETLPDTGRVTWDQVAEHEAFVIPTPIEVSPTRVEHPVTKPLEQLMPIEARSLVEDMRDVVVPAPIEVEHPDQPEPVRTFTPETPEPVRTFSPEVPEPQRLVAIHTSPTEARVPFPPEPVQPWSPQANELVARHPQLPPLQALKPVDVQRFAQPREVPLPRRAPLKEITVNRPPLKPIVVEPVARAPISSAPGPQPVVVPTAPAPKPLKQITIEPVVKYYDRSR